MAEYSRLATGQVVSNGGPTAVNLPFLPDYVEISNQTRAAAASGVTRAWWEVDMGQGAAFVVTTSAGPVDGTSYITAATGTGFSTFSAGIALQYGPTVQHGGSPVSDFSISKANPAIVTTVGNHGLVTGNVIVFQSLLQTSTTGMQQIASIPFVVTVLSATTFSIPWNTNQSNYTAFNTSTSTGNVGSYKQLLYPNVYAPNVGFISSLTFGASTVVSTTAPTNIQVGQQVGFRVQNNWGTVQLNELPNILIPGQPIYGFVTSVTNSTTFTVNINSSSYTAYNTNQTVAAVTSGGFTVPQVVAVGDANSGSNQLNFLPPYFYNGFGSSAVAANLGPAIAGSFCNNTSMGFLILGGVSGVSGDIIFWKAELQDLAL